MNIIKRSGKEERFDEGKIHNAITEAVNDVGVSDSVDAAMVSEIVSEVSDRCRAVDRIVTVEEVQNYVEDALMRRDMFALARHYITYRYKRAEEREGNTTDDRILAIVDGKSEEAVEENANKDPLIAATQRDYVAGEVSRDITTRLLLPKDVAEAHKRGIIHFHDADYFIEHVTNCELVNINDMLQNGTVISGTMIDKPHSFLTACNITMQIIAQIASSTYGGATISLAHLSPFVDVSRKRITNEVISELKESDVKVNKKQVSAIVEKRLDDEISQGIQCLTYQEITMFSTGGQQPFLSINLDIHEQPEGQPREDLARVIRVLLEQRIKGVKNADGVWVTPAFPKLLYFVNADNVKPGAPYWYLTELAAKCTAKRMVPDYISEKIMKEQKLSKGEKPGNGDAYPCMGCVDGDELITYKLKGELFVEAFHRMWDRLAHLYNPKQQDCGGDNLYMDLSDVSIYDTKEGFVNCKRIIRNTSADWLNIKMSNGRVLTCTPDHPFSTENRGRVFARDLMPEHDIILSNQSQYTSDQYSFDHDLAYAFGAAICDAALSNGVSYTFALTGEDDIIKELTNILSSHYPDSAVVVREHHRDVKGNYKELRISHGTKAQGDMITAFEGVTKKNRHVPQFVFRCDDATRTAFLAGMIDADGYIKPNQKLSYVDIGSTNKELAYQELALAQSLGMPAAIYENHYTKAHPKNIRYMVRFVPNDDLLDAIHCNKKKNSFSNNVRTNDSVARHEECTVTDIRSIHATNYSYDVTTESDHFEVSGIYSHNCRSFLTPDRSGNGYDNVANAIDYDPSKPKYYGRFNQGVCTISLPYVALLACRSSEAKGTDKLDEFWTLFDHYLEMCHRALQCRHERLMGTKSDVAPILWQHGALARLQPGETIDKLLVGGYSTISLGYAGLYEATVALTGHSHTDAGGKDVALAIMQHMNDKCSEWKDAEDIDYSVYGTPLESTTYKFAKVLQNEFGIIPDVTDHTYITNSYHVNVREEIDAFSKLGFEAEFQRLSPGGAISYVEIPNMSKNIEGVIRVIQFIYDHIMYAEMNTRSDHCDVCGYDGEITLKPDEHNHLYWECPNCGNRDMHKMSVVRRVCGYLGAANGMNQGRLGDIHDRVLHL